MTADGPGGDSTGTITWWELAADIADRLRSGGHDDATARRHGELIAQRACGAEPSDWAVLGGDRVTVRGAAAVEAMIARRLAGEPLQYVLGEWSFRHLDLYLDRRVLIPRPETEVVAGLALEELNRLGPGGAPITAVDLGTGSGAIGLSLVTEHPGAELWLTDASAGALAVARANLAGLGRCGDRVRLVEGSWFEALPGELRGRVEVVVSNPPYVAEDEVLPSEVAGWEPGSALFAGPVGTEHLLHLVDEAPSWLTPVGSLVLELAPHQVPVVVGAAADRFTEVKVVSDLTGRDRAVVARLPDPAVI
jgi:release factor glutamine methyltransferase